MCCEVGKGGKIANTDTAEVALQVHKAQVSSPHCSFTTAVVIIIIIISSVLPVRLQDDCCSFPSPPPSSPLGKVKAMSATGTAIATCTTTTTTVITASPSLTSLLCSLLYPSLITQTCQLALLSFCFSFFHSFTVFDPPPLLLLLLLPYHLFFSVSLSLSLARSFPDVPAVTVPHGTRHWLAARS